MKNILMTTVALSVLAATTPAFSKEAAVAPTTWIRHPASLTFCKTKYKEAKQEHHAYDVLHHLPPSDIIPWPEFYTNCQITDSEEFKQDKQYNALHKLPPAKEPSKELCGDKPSLFKKAHAEHLLTKPPYDIMINGHYSEEWHKHAREQTRLFDIIIHCPN